MTDQQNGRALRDDERIEALMPWLRGNKLDEADQQFINDNFLRVPDFEAKLAQETELAAALDILATEEAEESSRDANAAWAAFKSHLPDARTETSAPISNSTLKRMRGKTRTSSWRQLRLPRTKVGWLATAQTGALAGLALLFIPGQISQDAAQYSTLSSDEALVSTADGDAVLMFEPSASEATIRELLESAGAQITKGPMANGGYIISFDKSAKRNRIRSLRESDAVTMAEPLNLGE